MSVKDLLKNIFHRTPDPAKIKRKEHEKAKRTYTREVLYGDVQKWYKENKYKIILAAIGDYNYIKGDWCKFCKQKCRYNNGSV